MLAQEAPLIEQGAVQFILFGVTVIVIFIALWFTIASSPTDPARRPRMRRPLTSASAALRCS